MQGMVTPNYDDLVQCLTTLARESDAGQVPADCTDLYYHAIDLAAELDETGSLTAAVESREFDDALWLARDRSSE